MPLYQARDSFLSITIAMIPITANTNFGVPCDKFALYAAASCQLSISADGVNFTNFGDPFTGTKFFKDAPRSVYYRVSSAAGLSY